MRLANKGISSFNRGRIRAEGQGLVLQALHDAPPTSHLSSTLIIIHYSIFISHPQAAESSVCNGRLGKGGVAAHRTNVPVPLKARTGWFGQQPINRWLERTTPSARVKVASRNFLGRAATPPLPRRGIRTRSSLIGHSTPK